MEKQRPGKARERRRARTKQLILSAAEEILNEKGPEALSMRELASRIEYSPAALYEYFGSKEEIITALCEKTLIGLAEVLSEIPPQLPPAERLLRAGLTYLRFARAFPQQYLLTFSSGRSEQNPLHLVEASQAYNLLRQIIADGIDQGVFLPRPDYGLAEMTYHCWAIVHGMAMLHLTLLSSEGQNLEDLHERVLRGLIAGLQHP
ncbi:MAG: TetR/AcrR family transcriptional regulator [Thermogemmatispora sp.]|uniref:TetR/AcrR family transcriptional regulator n=1 Tax=Thermogemmatispora sp. TaxID=1968838 RepID=UPI002604B252|nr:TetR/AcrR family transcriptional regulator [Thermogemmatispora sp.]MBX5458144.1 TetR/AcrR family transcriptional regulator [Thermogemmatispora sp.]